MEKILYPIGTEVEKENNTIRIQIPFAKFTQKEVLELKENAQTLQDIIKTGLHCMYQEMRLVSKTGGTEYNIVPETLTVEILEDRIVQTAEVIKNDT